MKIAAVEAIALSAPFEKLFGSLEQVPVHVLRPAANQVTVPRLGQASTIVRVRTDGGITGIGEAAGLPVPEVTATIVAGYLRRLLLGQDPRDTAVLWDLMYGAQRGNGQTAGYMLHAIAGVDAALWDIKGKALGLPVYKLLGGAVRDRIPVYASPVPFMPTPEASAREARALVARGFRGVKVKVGRGVAADVAHMAAVREAVGPDVRVMLDANCAYDARTASTLAREALPYDPFWLEEPVPPEDVAGLAEVRRRSDVPVVAGESLHGAFAMRELLVRGAVDVVQPNVARAGGLTECARIGELARLFNVKVSPHGVGSALGIVTALHWCATLPHLLNYEANQFPNPLRECVLKQPVVLDDGHYVVPAGPGLGVELDEDAIEPYVVGRY